jgi:protocatechuate 3,4-dioxygenase beta subunit
MTLALAVCLAAVAFRAAAQSPAASKEPAKASLEGSVVKESAGEPLKKAIIELIGEDQEVSGNYTATSDQEGHFKVTGIQPGRYRLFVERTGYLEVDGKHRRSTGIMLSFESGQELKDQVLRMLPSAIITGRVVDEEGDPMPDVEIAVLRRKRSAGRMRFEPNGSAQTNDLGEFRIGGLFPGKYYVSASPLPSFQSIVPPPKNAEDPSAPPADLSYVPTLYPNATDRAQASTIELHAGDDMPVNFSLARVHTVHIRGSVEGLAPGSKAVVMMRGKDSNATFNAAEVGKDGKFEVLHVAPGTYSLMAMTVMSDKPQIMRRTIDVAESNLDDIRLTPQFGATLRGQVHFAAKIPHIDSSVFMLSLHSHDEDYEFIDTMSFTSDDAMGFRSAAKLKNDGSFELKNVPPGSYEIDVSTDTKALADAYVESVIAGMKEVVDTGLNISGGTLAVDVTVSNGAGVVDGTATNDKSEAVPNAVVVAIPAPNFRNQSDRYTRVATDQSGRFTMRGLRPGEYRLLAWEVLEGDEYLDPDFLKPLEDKAVVLKVEKGARQSVALKVIPEPTDQP